MTGLRGGTAVQLPTLVNPPFSAAVTGAQPPTLVDPPSSAVLNPPPPLPSTSGVPSFSPPPPPSSSSSPLCLTPQHSILLPPTSPSSTTIVHFPSPLAFLSTPLSTSTDPSLDSSNSTFKFATLSTASLSGPTHFIAASDPPLPPPTLPTYTPESHPSASASSSNIDAETLELYGHYIAQDAVGIIWQTILISTYGIFFGIAVYSTFRKGFKSHSSVVILCVIASLYASSLSLWALNTTVWLQTEHTVLMNHPNIPLPDRTALVNDNIVRFNIPGESLYLFNMVIADSVVIWRAWVLYPRTLWVVSIPCLMLLISSIFGIIEVTCLIGARYDYQAYLPDGGRVCSHANVSWAFSLATNATCTLLIGYKAWQHRRSMKSLNITIQSSKMSADKVLSILVESGFIYCLFWLTQIITFVNIDRQKPAIYVWEIFFPHGGPDLWHIPHTHHRHHES
ncbi:hypothetical protein MVEN_01364700 [Mycena venus]|uniref:Uncharacterized protein n=1 Tax=Mycena venus TaxID=2733690 RepID=A0A8H7CSA8_9AGAR|nr:hypothetical protein MVEN_01364700 [Mycena venus]